MTAVAVQAPAHRIADPMDAPALRWGVLGAGWIADVFARSVLGHTRSRIQAIGSRDAHRGNLYSAKYDVPTVRFGDGAYEAIMGDTVPRPANGKLSVRARVLGAGGKKVAVYTGKGRVAILDVKGKDATLPLAVTLGDGPDYVRAELRTFPHLAASMTAITNPIYVAAAGKAETP